MVNNPVVLEYWDCVAKLFGDSVSVSSLGAAALELTSFGADQILVPAPTAEASHGIEHGLEMIPPNRRHLIRRVDENGRVLSLVQQYLRPIAEVATGEAERNFVHFTLQTMYKVALGCRYKAAVIDARLEHVPMFLRVIDKSLFHGDAAFKIREIASLAFSFDGQIFDRLQIIAAIADSNLGRRLFEMLESSEYHSLVTTGGKIALAKNPRVALRQLKKKVSGVVRTPAFNQLVAAGTTASQLPGSPINLTPIRDLARVLGLQRDFSPVLLDLPNPVFYQIYQNSLSAAGRNLVPPDGMAYQTLDSLFGLGDSLPIEMKNQISYDPKKRLASLKKFMAEAKIAMSVPDRYINLPEGELA
jgi:hypothetical protein